MNVLLFVPYGFSLRSLGASRAAILLTGFFTSAVIELLQLWIPGRDTSLRDTLANTMGASLGAAVCSHWRLILLPHPSRARNLALCWTLLWLLLASFTMWSLEPAPTPRFYFGQWAPEDVYPASFRGSVLSARVNGVAIPPGRLDTSALLRKQFARDSSHTEVTAVLGAPTEKLSSILSIADDQRREILLIGQRGPSFVFRMRMRASQFRLRNFGIALTTARAKQEQLLTIAASRSSSSQSIRTTDGRSVQTKTLSLTPRLGWTLFAPFPPILGPRSEVLSALWLVLMLLPIGYWAARNQLVAPRFAMLVTFGGIFVPLWLPSMIFGGAPPSMWDCGASSLGAAAGWVLSRVIARLATSAHGSVAQHDI